MGKSNEQNKEMTAAESLALITETLNNSRKDILNNSSKYLTVAKTSLTTVPSTLCCGAAF